jgi:hypothetical protein
MTKMHGVNNVKFTGISCYRGLLGLVPIPKCDSLVSRLTGKAQSTKLFAYITKESPYIRMK